MRPEVECFARPYPVVTNVPAGTYGPYKLSVLTTRKATSKMPGPKVSQNRDIQNNNSLPCWISTCSCRNMTKEVYRSQNIPGRNFIFERLLDSLLTFV